VSAARARGRRIAERATEAVVTRVTVPLLYRHVSQGRSWLVIAMCAPDVANSAAGNSCLGGYRVGRRSYRDWFDRMFRLTRSVRPTAESVRVTGTLAKGTVDVEFSDPVVSPDGQVFLNHGHHLFALRNGRIAAVELAWDPRIAQSCCEHTAALGRSEALALPLG